MARSFRHGVAELVILSVQRLLFTELDTFPDIRVINVRVPTKRTS